MTGAVRDGAFSDRLPDWGLRGREWKPGGTESDL